MQLELRYFASVREQVGRGAERAEVPADVLTVGDLRAWLRARGDVDVQAIAGRFGGGGHKKAAGATIQLGLPDAERALEEAIQQALAAQDAAGSPPAAT